MAIFLKALPALREKHLQRLSGDNRARALLDRLFLNPHVSVARVAKILAVSIPTASKSIRTLERTGMLGRMTGKEWGRIWVARPIMKIVGAAEPRA